MSFPVKAIPIMELKIGDEIFIYKQFHSVKEVRISHVTGMDTMTIVYNELRDTMIFSRYATVLILV
jgi:hypothetical protein